MRNLRSSKRKQKKPYKYSFVRTILIVALLVFSLILLADSSLSLLTGGFLVSVFVIIIVQTRFLLQHLFNPGKYFLYLVSSLGLLSAFYFLLLYLMKTEIKSFDRSDLFSEFLPVFIISSVLVMLYSFLYHYAGLAKKDERGWAGLVEGKMINYELVFHSLIIAGLFIISALNMDGPSELRSIFEILFGLVVFYVTAYFLVTKYLLKQKYVQFVFYSSITLVGFAGLIVIMGGIFTYSGLRSSGLDMPFLKTLDVPSLDILIFAMPAVIYAYARQLFIDRESKGYTLYRQKEAEFNQLRSQVNPHFLFNSLNTVYAYALKEGNEKTAESIAKLANLMRYLIDDMEQDKIPVKKEIGYIEDYIKLQLIRSSVTHEISIIVDLNEEQEGKMIAPMLMIPFVENAFKHGINPNAPSGLKIKVSFVDERFQFVIENSVDNNFEAFYKEKGFGIGIENIRKRLEYIYPDKHTLSIADTDDRFIVIMNIDL